MAENPQVTVDAQIHVYGPALWPLHYQGGAFMLMSPRTVSDATQTGVIVHGDRDAIRALRDSCDAALAVDAEFFTPTRRLAG